ncbi:MAG TPA: hypothetical protein VMF90_21250 [Rhizobiaceae bacterium]|nr:hypothetical protein [Rhizobiaceae bacterium]
MSSALYPEMIGSSSFLVDGFARCIDVGQRITEPVVGRVAAGFYHFGPDCFHVHQFDQRGSARDPSFVFYPLKVKFVADAVGYDPEFRFSLAYERLGQVTYVSGAAARDTGGVYQSIRSVNGAGHWGVEGLHLSLAGELDQTPVPHFRTQVPNEHFRDKYELAVHVPWEVLKHMFYEQIHFVIGNYEKHVVRRGELSS